MSMSMSMYISNLNFKVLAFCRSTYVSVKIKTFLLTFYWIEVLVFTAFMILYAYLYHNARIECFHVDE